MSISTKSTVPHYRTFIQKMRTSADEKDLLQVFEPYFEILERALPRLDAELTKIRVNEGLTPKFKTLSFQVLNDGDYSPEILHSIAQECPKTIGDLGCSGILSISKGAYKIIENIEEIIADKGVLEKQKGCLEITLSSLS